MKFSVIKVNGYWDLNNVRNSSIFVAHRVLRLVLEKLPSKVWPPRKNFLEENCPPENYPQLRRLLQQTNIIFYSSSDKIPNNLINYGIWKRTPSNLPWRSKGNTKIRSIAWTTPLQLVWHMLPEMDCKWNVHAKTSLARQIWSL